MTSMIRARCPRRVLLHGVLCILALHAAGTATALGQDGKKTDAPATPAPEEAKKPVDDGKDPNVKRDVSQFNLGKDGLALSGYDPVSYRDEGGGKPKEGKKDITYRYRGVLYRFVSDDNKKKFVDDPQKFEPAYGGWCAYAMAKDDKVEIDPESFLIQDGKLLVFYDGFLAHTRTKWQDEGKEKLKKKADHYWAKKLAAK